LQPSTLAKRGPVLLFLAVVAFYFYGLGQIPLVGPDEPRYAQVAREMLLRHDLITPTLGGHTWFEKPALLYWLMIASFKLFGVTEWAARLPAALSGLLTIAAVFVVGRRVERDEREHSDRPPANAGGSDQYGFAFWSALAAATTIGIVAFSRAASFDIILTMTTSWTLAFYLLHEFEPEEKRRWKFLAGFYAFIGLSLLAKGLVGIVIPAGVIGLYYLFQRKLPRRNTWLSVLWGAPLALVVAATWYGPVIARHGWPFIDEFFIQHHFARYVSDKYHHWRPAYYYLQVVPLLALPWTAFFVDGLLQTRAWLRRASVRDHAQTGSKDLPLAYADGSDRERLNRLMVFALAWFLFPLVFFSFSGSKLPGYIVPVLPAVALIVGERLWRCSADVKQRRWAVTTTATFFLLFAICGLAYSWWTNNIPHDLALLVATPLLLAGGFSFFMRRTPAAAIVIAGATVVVLIVSLHLAAPNRADAESSKRLLQLADARGYSQTAIFGLERSDRTPEFYGAGRVVYGADGEPIMYEGPGQLAYEARRRGEAILAFVPIADLRKLTQETSAQTEIIGANHWYAIVAVRAR
jgi:4-amino-4-deoxy-L-arabinose transferase-like glycosyltransferase